ncbi:MULTISPECIES: acetyl-CoA C-acyltransferase family protein [unclassified Azospirillum]|uniref:acetyl-CoA C-acyltransferase family protein n=1 Tax=unclassified Azospirillum TaxID=2630922 RepID=UPI000B6C7923|nr:MULTISPECIES: acetyl-CoA C-acyltransferase family protein [unclassified Azospirillum]SNS18506.1 acetyl-CoA acetyltransferase /3-ketoacyl-CoA thiolase [Azospirillum sp. RU38E]SNS36128.1 acetyl-CoA acetyltransferase /3-ketoacyl-CoA thiolase [Azospirillum sp. RU37A]
MGALNEVVIVSGTRTAIGGFGGSLKDIAPAELGSLVIAEAVRRAGLTPADVQHVVMGQVIPSGPQDAYLARVAAVNAGIPTASPALTLNRLCGSGVQAIISAAQMIRLGECEVAVAGGAESMSRSPHVIPSVRWGQRMGDAALLDAMVTVLTDPFHKIHMGITAENVAERHEIDRAAQDALALESHSRAARAIAEGRFKDQILPVEVKARGGTRLFDTDEHVRPDAKPDDFAKLKPAFKKDGTVTAGNASGVNDGAAAVTLMAVDAAAARGIKPMARILGWGHAGVEPEVMGLGPVHAVPIALQRAGLSLADIDVIESNEAFASQACAVSKLLGFDPAKVNPNGSGVSLGHPVGATGAIITVKAIYELARTGGRYGLVTMCIGGGQGIAMVVERV